MFCKEVVLMLHLVSTHFAPGYNNENYGAGVECRAEHFQAAVGGYHNSFHKPTVYGVVGKDFITVGRYSIGGVAGLASGYEKKMPTPFIAGARFSAEFGRVRINVFGYPPVGESDGLAHLAIGWTL